jgi:hypothetical protein
MTDTDRDHIETELICMLLCLYCSVGVSASLLVLTHRQ